MGTGARRLSAEEVRDAARLAASDVLDPGDPRAAVEELCEVGMRGASASALGAGLWQIWDRIRTELIRDSARGAGLARESALDLLEAIDDAAAEREYCDRWIHDERFGGGPGPA